MYIACQKSKKYLLVLLFVVTTIFITKEGIAKAPLVISPGGLSVSLCGKKIAFGVVTKDGSDLLEKIQIMHTDGSNLQQIPVSPGSVVTGSFAWSFNSKKVAFSIIDNNTRTIHIHIVDVQSLKDKEVTTGNSGDFTAKWSSDGNKIGFVRMKNIHSKGKKNLKKLPSRSNLWLVDIDNNQEKQLTTTNNVYPLGWDWGHNDEKCFYLVRKGGLIEVWSIDIQARKEEKLYSLKGWESGARFISCSPNGENILLFWQSSLVKGDLWLLKADGSDKTKLSSKKCALMPTWITDNRILTVDKKGGMWDFDIEKNQYKRLGLEVTSREPAWGAKTNKIFFIKEGRTIWTMNGNGSNPQQIYPEILSP